MVLPFLQIMIDLRLVLIHSRDIHLNSHFHIFKLEDELVSMNFKNHAEKNLKTFRSLFPSQPIWIMEYWAGWFDWWGEGRNLFDNKEFEENFDALVTAGASINFYMFDGGTNFGFTNGGLYIARDYYTADVTSYDYDCPISETGNLTEKYFIIKNRIGCGRPDLSYLEYTMYHKGSNLYM